MAENLAGFAATCSRAEPLVMMIAGITDICLSLSTCGLLIDCRVWFWKEAGVGFIIQHSARYTDKSGRRVGFWQKCNARFGHAVLIDRIVVITGSKKNFQTGITCF